MSTADELQQLGHFGSACITELLRLIRLEVGRFPAA